MATLSPSIIRLERPLGECVRLFNGLGCESVHVDVCAGVSLPGFFVLDEIQLGALCAFNAQVTVHVFCLEEHIAIERLSLRPTDLVVLHVFPKTTPKLINAFLASAEQAGCRSGLSLDLETDMSAVHSYLHRLDTVFVMGIPVAAFGLQPHNETTARLSAVAQRISEKGLVCRIGLDGGVNVDTFAQLVTLADEVVVGSLLLHTSDLLAQWKSLASLAKGGG